MWVGWHVQFWSRQPRRPVQQLIFGLRCPVPIVAVPNAARDAGQGALLCHWSRLAVGSHLLSLQAVSHAHSPVLCTTTRGWDTRRGLSTFTRTRMCGGIGVLMWK